ncbi:serine-rich adhesin for platelets-like [Haliotis cracherodii]|uniref:serine-rich adhesin for platelets-like n=1 Tax=Haliotis cracherodii TaxID=6455 RepID=UPI0039EAA279
MIYIKHVACVFLLHVPCFVQLGEDDVGNSCTDDLHEPLHYSPKQPKLADLGRWQTTCLDLSEISEKDESYSLSFEDEDTCEEEVVEEVVEELDEEVEEEKGFEEKCNEMYSPRAGLMVDDGAAVMTQKYVEDEHERRDKDDEEEGDGGGGDMSFGNSGIIPHDTVHLTDGTAFERELDDSHARNFQVESICDDPKEVFSSEHLIDENMSVTYCVEQNHKLQTENVPFNWSILENAKSASLSGTYTLESSLEQRDSGDVHISGFNGDNMKDRWGKLDVSPDASLDAASTDRHLDWTSEDYLSDTSSSDSREMQGLMDEYEKLVKEESEEELYTDLKTELAEAIANDDILGGDGVKDGLEMNSSQHSDDIQQQFAFDGNFDGERESCQSHNSSYRDYCISVFDSSAEYDRSPVQVESPRTLKSEGEENSECLLTIQRLTLPSDLGASSTLTSSERKELTDEQNDNESAKFASSCSILSETDNKSEHDALKHLVSDAVRSFIDDASNQQETGNGYLPHVTSPPLGGHDDVFHCQDIIYPSSPQQAIHVGDMGDFQGIDELPVPTEEHVSFAPEFDEDILPRVADEELENAELGEDVLFFIPGTMESIDEASSHDIHESRDQHYSISSEEQLIQEATSEDQATPRELYQENHANPECLRGVVKQGCLLTKEFNMFYMGEEGSINNNSDKEPDVNECQANEDITMTPVYHRTDMQEMNHTGLADSFGSRSRFCDRAQAKTKSQPLSFQSVLLEISQRGKKMKDNITYGLKEHPESEYGNNNKPTMTSSTQEKPSVVSNILPQSKEVSKTDLAQQKFDVSPKNETGKNIHKGSASSFLGNFVKQISKVEDTSLEFLRGTLSDHGNGPKTGQATVSCLKKMGSKSSFEACSSDEAKIESIMSSMSTVPPVLSSWKAKCAAAAALAEKEDQDVVAHKNPVITQAFGQVVSQLKEHKDTTHKKRKVYSKRQEELCVSQLTEHFAQVKVMGKPGIRVHESQEQQFSRDQTGIQVLINEEDAETPKFALELQELANMQIVSGHNTEDVSIRPKDPRKMLESFFTNLVANQGKESKQVKTIDSVKKKVPVMKTEEKETTERHRSVAERVSMFQTVVSSNQKGDTNSKLTGTSSIKKSLSNLLNDLKSKGKTATPEPKCLTVTKEQATNGYQEPKSNFLRQRRLSLMKKENESEIESADVKDSGTTSEVEQKLANLLSSMTNSPRRTSEANVHPIQSSTQNSGVAEKSDAAETTTESPRTFFENFLKRRPSKTKNEATSVVPSDNSLTQKIEVLTTKPNLSLCSQYTSKKSVTLKPQGLQNDGRETFCKEQTKAVNRVSKTFPSHLTETVITQAKCQDNALPIASTHSTKFVPDRSANTHSDQTHRIEQALTPQSVNVKPLKFKQTDVCDGKKVNRIVVQEQEPSTTDFDSSPSIPQTSSHLGLIPQISSYLKVKSFEMLAQSFDEEIGNISFSEDNGDLHLNLSDLNEPCCAQSTPRNLQFFRNSSTFFNLTPRSDGDDGTEFISPRISNIVPKAWGPDGAREITVTVKPSPPCTDVLMNLSPRSYKTSDQDSQDDSPREKNHQTRHARRPRKPVVTTIRSKFENEVDKVDKVPKEKPEPGVKSGHRQYDTWSGKAPSLRELVMEADEEEQKPKPRNQQNGDTKSWQRELQTQLNMRNCRLSDPSSPRRSQSESRRSQRRERIMSAEVPSFKSTCDVSSSKSSWFSSSDVSKGQQSRSLPRKCSSPSCSVSSYSLSQDNDDMDWAQRSSQSSKTELQSPHQVGSMPDLSPTGSSQHLNRPREKISESFTRTTSVQNVYSMSRPQYVSSKSSLFSLSSRGSTDSLVHRNVNSSMRKYSSSSSARASQDSLLMDEFEDEQIRKQQKISPPRTSLESLAEEIDTNIRVSNTNSPRYKTNFNTVPRNFKSRTPEKALFKSSSVDQRKGTQKLPTSSVGTSNTGISLHGSHYKNYEVSTEVKELSKMSSGGNKQEKTQQNFHQIKDRFSKDEEDGLLKHSEKVLIPSRKSLLDKFERLQKEISEDNTAQSKLEVDRCLRRTSSGEHLAQVQKKLLDRRERKTLPENRPPAMTNTNRCALIREKFEKLTKAFDCDEFSKVEDMKNRTRDRMRRLSSGLNVSDIQKKFSADSSEPQTFQRRTVRPGSRSVSELFLHFEKGRDESMERPHSSITRRKEEPKRWSSDVPSFYRNQGSHDMSNSDRVTTSSSDDQTSDDMETNNSHQTSYDCCLDKRGQRSQRSAANMNFKQLAAVVRHAEDSEIN